MEFLGFTIDVANLTSNALSLVIKVALAILIFVVGRWLAKKAVTVAHKMMLRSRLDDTVANFLGRLIYGVLLVVVALAALSKVGVQTTSVVAILGGAAVAIGLSLKDQLSNFAAGIMIVTFRPFVRGDYVQISSYTGTVTEITLVNTHLTTINNHDIIIPNSDITTSAVTNYTALPNRRVDITVGIGYDADIKTAKNVMLNLAKNNPLAFTDPEPIVRVTNLGDNSVDLTLNIWTTNADWWTMQCDLLEQFKYALDDEKIDIPFPQRNVHVKGLDQMINQMSQAQKLPMTKD
ncbi:MULTISPECIES: mechanosensitive ion channel family protein [Psychrobacter]|uniref:Small-conductance mechanosensitive channel n=1 Tax=Psychrobacter immobilis TaxID=498 RepID=A0A2V1ZHC4_PSYIM|nr:MULTISPECIES: mechanosensitive ion channel domain-containing protein [Psychrobacter]MBE8609695.1 mechanosensitive ion channel [Pseudomonas lundensis]KRG34030.1 mechanosensitive ion channel protein MscS [Psychrobacter sp. P11F6]MCG3872801.1 mechanosensitive ion channel [Psychrobacter sp. Ps7]MDN5560861.1 mechanosensitive ion channel [Psychrobacter sp.]PWK06213.1 small conductance mechanosensitive channel [Psychrobacter immobilis]